MYQVIWEYKAKPKTVSKFEELYGPKGERVKLFSQSKNYQGTELLLDDEGDLSYITIDFWESESAYNDFMQTSKEKYDLLDQKGNVFVKSKKRVWI